MANWAYNPDYLLIIEQPGGKQYFITTMQSIDAQLVTSAGINQMRVLAYDPGEYINNLTDSNGKLHPMQSIQFRTVNRYGQWGVAFSGYIDSVNHVFDPEQGDLIQIMCSSPMKLWQITRTNASAALTLGLGFTANIGAAQVLKYSTTQVGFPSDMCYYDPIILAGADAGSGYQGNALSQVFTNPETQDWASVVESLLNNAGLEWFFNELGYMIFRRNGYLNVPVYGYRPVQEEEILNADLGESDEGVINRVEVRYSITGDYYAQTQAVKQAPQTMIDHLHFREVVFYAPWISSGNKDAADYLAQVLLQQYSANILTATVTIPADPMFQLGTVCEVPTLRNDDSTMLFYISSVTYQCQWNGHWTMTLGLTYGRAKGQSFPYGENATYPIWTPGDTLGLPSETAMLTVDPHNDNKITTPFIVQNSGSVTNCQVMIDSGFITAGSKVQIKDRKGNQVGRCGSDLYTVVAGPTNTNNTNPTIFLKNPKGKEGYITIVQNADQTLGTNGTTDQFGGGGDATPPGASGNTSNATASPGSSGTPTALQAPYDGASTSNLFQPFGHTNHSYEPDMLSLTKNSWYPSGYFHTGLDFPAPLHTLLHAVADGTIIGYQVDTSGYGKLLVLQSGDYDFLYAHTAWNMAHSFDAPQWYALVQVGQTVKAGQPLGYSASTGNSTGPHLHFGIFDVRNGRHYPNWYDEGDTHYIDPFPLFQSGGV